MSDDGGDFSDGGMSEEYDDENVEFYEESELDDAVETTPGAEFRKKKVKIPNHERITSQFMTKYEKARILGSRAL